MSFLPPRGKAWSHMSESSSDNSRTWSPSVGIVANMATPSLHHFLLFLFLSSWSLAPLPRFPCPANKQTTCPEDVVSVFAFRRAQAKAQIAYEVPKFSLRPTIVVTPLLPACSSALPPNVHSQSSLLIPESQHEENS